LYDRPDPVFTYLNQTRPKQPSEKARGEERLPLPEQEITPDRPREEGEPNAPCSGCPLERRLSARVLGTVTVDLGTGKVIRRSGAVL